MIEIMRESLNLLLFIVFTCCNLLGELLCISSLLNRRKVGNFAGWMCDQTDQEMIVRQQLCLEIG